LFINNARGRFPNEPRFRLAQVVWGITSRRKGDLERLAKDPAVGADALVQLAYLEFFERDYDTAITYAKRAAGQAVEPTARYVAHFIAGFCHEVRGRPADAVGEYAGALKAFPRGQSASIALALLLARDNQGETAFDLIDRSLAAYPDGYDPWRLFSYGGYARWPTLIADLRKVIR
jgi:tetratricopeptide (TPR) repeat protein